LNPMTDQLLLTNDDSSSTTVNASPDNSTE